MKYNSTRNSSYHVFCQKCKVGKSVDSSVHVSLSFFLTRAETLAVLQEAGTELQAALSKGIFDAVIISPASLRSLGDTKS